MCFQDKWQGGRKGKISAFLPPKTQPRTFAKPGKQPRGVSPCSHLGCRDGAGGPTTESISPAPHKARINPEQGRHDIYGGVLSVCPPRAPPGRAMPRKYKATARAVAKPRPAPRAQGNPTEGKAKLGAQTPPRHWRIHPEEVVLGAPLTPRGLAALQPLRGFAEAQASLAPRKGVAHAFLGFTFLLAWAQAEAEGDFSMASVRHQEGIGCSQPCGKVAWGCHRVKIQALLSPKQVLDGFRVKKLCQLLPAASPWGSRDARPHAWGTVRASSSHGSDNPAGRPGDEAGPRSNWGASRVHSCGGAETATTQLRGRAGGPRLSLNGLLGPWVWGGGLW